MGLANVQFSVATHIMAVLADRSDGRASTDLLAESVNSTPTFVRKSVSKLAKAGLLKAIRGKHGYCTLAKPASAITLADIYRASLPPALYSVHGYPVAKHCRVSVHIQAIMSDLLPLAEAGFLENLSHTTLADVVREVRQAT